MMPAEAHIDGERVNIQPFINGRWIEDHSPASGPRVADLDPSTGKLLASLPLPDERLAHRAMTCAYDAWRDWRRWKRQDRASLLEKLADAIESRHRRMVTVIQAETGMLTERANEEVAHGVQLLRATARHNETSAHPVHQGAFPTALVDNAPFGVVVWIKSWNSPIAALCKIGAALLAGNTVVLKVSGRAPLCGCIFAEAVQEVGFPPGVVNLLWDEGGELAGHLVRHPLLGKCAVTGSLDTGRRILAAIAERGIRPTFMETGGGGIQVIFQDAEIEQALPHVFWGALTLSGQICCAGTRILVQRPLLKRVVAELAGMTESLRVGSAHDPETQLGPVISESSVLRLRSLLDRTRKAGGIVVTEPVSTPDAGFFVSPAVVMLDDINAPPYQEEIFGPMIVLAPFDRREDALSLLEGMPAGLALALYTSTPEWINSRLNDLLAGTVWVNGYYQSTVEVPFGGMKDSGYGREKGEAGLREFAQARVVVGAAAA